MQLDKALEQFVVTAQSRSMREAAETLHTTSSALNRRILELENELGTKLFERHARGIRLSAAGEIYLEYARKVMLDSEKAQSRIDDLKGLRRGKVRIAVNGAGLGGRLIKVLAAFQASYPRIEASVLVTSTDEIVKAISNHDVDIGVAFAPPSHSEFRALAQVDYFVHAVLSSRHPLASKREVSISDLKGFPIAIGDRSLSIRLLLDEYLAATGLELRPSFVSNSFSALLGYIRATEAVGFQLRPSPNPEVMEGCVAIEVSELRRYKRPMVLGVSRTRALPVAAALLCEAMSRDLFLSPASGAEGDE